MMTCAHQLLLGTLIHIPALITHIHSLSLTCLVCPYQCLFSLLYFCMYTLVVSFAAGPLRAAAHLCSARTPPSLICTSCACSYRLWTWDLTHVAVKAAHCWPHSSTKPWGVGPRSHATGPRGRAPPGWGTLATDLRSRCCWRRPSCRFYSSAKLMA